MYSLQERCWSSFVLTLSVPGLRVAAWVNSFPRQAPGANACPLACRGKLLTNSVTVSGVYGMLGFASWKVFFMRNSNWNCSSRPNSLGPEYFGTGSDRDQLIKLIVYRMNSRHYYFLSLVSQFYDSWHCYALSCQYFTCLSPHIVPTVALTLKMKKKTLTASSPIIR